MRNGFGNEPCRVAARAGFWVSGVYCGNVGDGEMVGDGTFIGVPVLLFCKVDKYEVADFEGVIEPSSSATVVTDTEGRIVCPLGIAVIPDEDDFPIVDRESIIVERIVGSRIGWMMGTFVVWGTKLFCKPFSRERFMSPTDQRCTTPSGLRGR